MHSKTVVENEPLVKKKPWLTDSRKESLNGYLFISPFFILFAIFSVFPIYYSFHLAFHRWNGLAPVKEFVGFKNFEIIFNDPLFWKALSNTVLIGIMGTVPQLIIGIILAFALNSALIRFRNVFRTAYFLPYITSIVAVAVIFSILFSNQSTGLINGILQALDIDPIMWTSSEWGAKIAISAMIFWRWVGYNTIIYLAGLQSIPGDLYEAAKIDGAKTWQQILYISIPLLKPFIMFTVFFATLGALLVFVEPLIFTGVRAEGITVAVYLYRDAFILANPAFGTASATAVFLFLLILSLSIINLSIVNLLGRTKKGRNA
ncbi:carbohydrate ABC transporter permease [Caldalkalibacillus mannanilyticus]|uniref:carbohydrate ABC transporter permease n=1 Tax=Caldalkalibacillus mannanilyticus TaxID=1418 RepID=UPI000469981C|nr:sugar ABC transporter permease [Caldalkalibacillus mannanilyticus]